MNTRSTLLNPERGVRLPGYQPRIREFICSLPELLQHADDK